MRRLLFYFVILIGSLSLKAANPFHESYDWMSTFNADSIAGDNSGKTAILKDLRVIEYVKENEKTKSYVTHHRIVKVNDDRSVEVFNRVFIPLKNRNNVISLKARSINRNGQVKEFNRENLHELKNVEDMGNFAIFAMEGVEKDGYVEYLYTVMQDAEYYGQEIFQDDMPVHDAEFRIYCPVSLEFTSKSYNGFPTADSLIQLDQKTLLRAHSSFIPALLEEEYSAYKANLQKVMYKMRRNDQVPGMAMFTYAQAGQKFYYVLHDYTRGTLKLCKHVLAPIIKQSPNEDIKIAAIHELVRKNFSVVAKNGEEYEDVNSILKNRFANEVGMQKLYNCLFEAAGVNVANLFTTNRFTQRFDNTFESWSFLNEPLLYFPDTKKYVDPVNPRAEYGSAPYEYCENYALFILQKKGHYGGQYTNVIHAPDMKFSRSDIFAEIHFTENFEKSILSLLRENSGYRANELRSYLASLDPEFLDDYTKLDLKSIGSDAEVKDAVLENGEENLANKDKSVIIKGNVEISSLIEKAGSRYIFKIGEILGEQNEMYQEEKRMSDVDFRYPMSYSRKINITIPDGYHISNPDDLNFNINSYSDSTKTCGFKSSYTLKGNRCEVEILEFYTRCFYPMAEFESFRKVVNAAADFNKVVLVFEKNH